MLAKGYCVVAVGVDDEVRAGLMIEVPLKTAEHPVSAHLEFQHGPGVDFPVVQVVSITVPFLLKDQVIVVHRHGSLEQRLRDNKAHSNYPCIPQANGSSEDTTRACCHGLGRIEPWHEVRRWQYPAEGSEIESH